MAGNPLIFYTIDAALKSKYIDEIIVSTDDVKISEISRNLGAKAPFIRPKELSDDKASSESVIMHTIKWLEEKENEYYNYLILLQPTSPLRTSIHIDDALTRAFEDEALAIISVCKVRQHPHWMKTIDDNGFLKNYVAQEKKNTRRQELPEIFIPNGAIYAASVKFFKNNETFNTEKTMPYFMDEVESYDIDNYHDLEIVEFLLKKIHEI